MMLYLRLQINHEALAHGFAASPNAFISHERKQVIINSIQFFQ